MAVNIRKRRDASGRVRFVVEDSRDGKKIQVKPRDYGMATPETEREAKALARRYLQQVERMTVTEYVDRFCSRTHSHSGKPISEQTNRHYRKLLRPLVARFGDYYMDDVTPMEAYDFVTEASNLGRVKEFKALYAAANMDGVAETKPFARFVDKRQQSSRPREEFFLSLEDTERLEAACVVLGDWGVEVFRPLLIWTKWLGLRPGEGVGSEWDKYHQELRRYDVQRQWLIAYGRWAPPKWGSVGMVMVPEAAANAVEHLPRTTGVMFPSRKGKPISARTLQRSFNKVRDEAGLPHAQMKSLRHFCGSYLLNELGMQPYEIAIQLRHSDGGELVTRVYGHPNRELHLSRIEEAERRRSKYLGADCPQPFDESAEI